MSRRVAESTIGGMGNSATRCHALTQRLPVVFVAGLHRSGTSVLARVLSSSPDVRAMVGTGAPEDEGQHLQGVMSAAAAHGGPGLFAFDPGAHLTERSTLANPGNALRLWEAWSPHWRLDGAISEHDCPAVLLEKSPPNLVRLRFLHALFPAARFVVLVRHPAVVSASTRRWRPHLAMGTLLRHWAWAHRLYQRDRYGVEHVHEVRYEDLIARPADTVSALAAALGIRDEFNLDLVEGGHDDRHLQAWAEQRPNLDREDLHGLDKQARRFGYRMDEPFVT